jgi:hypothetical protein
MKVWTEHLKLTTDQQQKIHAILLEREQQWDRDHRRIMDAPRADRQKLRDEQRDHMQSYRDKLHAVLTPDQQKQALKLREMQRSTRRPMMRSGNRAGRGPGNGMHRGQ